MILILPLSSKVTNSHGCILNMKKIKFKPGSAVISEWDALEFITDTKISPHWGINLNGHFFPLYNLLMLTPPPFFFFFFTKYAFVFKFRPHFLPKSECSDTKLYEEKVILFLAMQFSFAKLVPITFSSQFSCISLQALVQNLGKQSSDIKYVLASYSNTDQIESVTKKMTYTVSVFLLVCSLLLTIL